MGHEACIRRNKKFIHKAVWKTRREESNWGLVCRQKNNMKVKFEEKRCESGDWIQLVHDKVKQGGPCEHDNEPMGSIKHGEITDHLHDYQLLKKGQSPCCYLEIEC